MPIFEYQCKSCGDRFEELVPSADTEAACPKCNSTDTGKLLSVFAAAGSSVGSSVPSCYRPGCGESGFA